MNSVAESYVETFDLVCQHIADEKEKNVMLQKLKAIALDHAKMEQEFDIKHKALRHVDKKLDQVSDLDIDKEIEKTLTSYKENLEKTDEQLEVDNKVLKKINQELGNT